MNNTLDLTKQLISIPSWVGNGCDEKKVGEFIFDWLRGNTDLTVAKQPVKDGRFNVLAYDNSPTTLLLAGHIDTVEPRVGWTTDTFVPTLKYDRLYGLGATDMKGSLAAMLTAVSEVKNTKGLMVLCYIDEEYDFAGMQSFIAAYKDQINPSLVVSLDGYKEVVGTGCRGLIEVCFRLRGKSGHAGRPEMGVNAIVEGTNCISKLKRQIASKYSDFSLGVSTLNLAYCRGGLDLGGGKLSKQGNNIPDLAEFILDIRPASSNLNASVVKELLGKYAKNAKLIVENFIVRHDLGSWSTNIEDIRTATNLSLKAETFGGYVDTQMIWTAMGKPTCLALGASTRSVAHSPNEYVEIDDLEITKNQIKGIIKGYV